MLCLIDSVMNLEVIYGLFNGMPFFQGKSPVRDADAARAVEYASLLGGIERTAVSDRDTVPAWASRLGADRRCGLRSGPVHRLPGRPPRGH